MKKAVCALLCLLLVFSLLLAGCGAPQSTAPAPAEELPEEEGGEYRVTGDNLRTDFVCEDNDRVFYEIFVGSFSDSDGDGIGDLRGIINRMDYLNDGDPDSGRSLGVEGLWLTPIFKSPSYHKYDVTDYYTIDPSFGTLEDLQELAKLCEERNVKLIIDLVLNHSGSQNKWFSEFKTAHRAGNTENPYYDYYTWARQGETPGGRTFRAVDGTEDYYECNFSGDMPELNYDNPAVREEMLNVAKYWLEQGVDGFRFDAIKYVYFGDHQANADFWSWYVDELRAVKPDIYTVGECWDSDGVTDVYYGALNCFNFTVSQAEGLIAKAAGGGDVSILTNYVESYVDRIRGLRSDAAIVPFVSNHDMDRAAGFLPVTNGRAYMAANLYLLGPGSPFLYYGEELGMKGSRGSSNTDANRRLAMVWGDGDTVADPPETSYDASKQVSATAADQITDPGSLYTYYKTLLLIRHANPEIARGEYHAVKSDSKLGGFVSVWNGSAVCVLHNTTQNELSYDLSRIDGFSFDEISAVAGLNGASLEGTVLTLGPQTSAVLREG